jgi:phage terminase large subunit-like protein
MRAEPVAMLYEQGQAAGAPFVHHIGELPELEDQMCNWTGEPGQPSPDRLDALVWAMAELAPDFTPAPEVREIEVGIG